MTYYQEVETTHNYTVQALGGNQSNWTETKITLILLGEEFVEFIQKANAFMVNNDVSRYREIFEVSVSRDSCGDRDYPVQYNISFESGLGEQDDEIMEFIRQWKSSDA